LKRATPSDAGSVYAEHTEAKYRDKTAMRKMRLQMHLSRTEPGKPGFVHQPRQCSHYPISPKSPLIRDSVTLRCFPLVMVNYFTEVSC
jgi:hypothetical protein